jgi:hypothetical protein
MSHIDNQQKLVVYYKDVINGCTTVGAHFGQVLNRFKALGVNQSKRLFAWWHNVGYPSPGRLK